MSNGVITFATGAWGAKVHEVAPYITKVNFGSQFAGGIAMNKGRFDKLPPEVQKVFRDVGDEYSVRFAAAQTAAAAGLLKMIPGAGSVAGGVINASVASGLTLAMAMLPEEFPVVLTTFLALGAWRLSRHRVLTRRVAAVETLGAATVLWVDKTGTLTLNDMEVRAPSVPGARLQVGSDGSELPEEFHEVDFFLEDDDARDKDEHDGERGPQHVHHSHSFVLERLHKQHRHADGDASRVAVHRSAARGTRGHAEARNGESSWIPIRHRCVRFVFARER